MKNIRNLAAVVALTGLLGSVNAANAAEASSKAKVYVELGGVWSNGTDVDAKFTSDNASARTNVKKEWDIDSLLGGKVQIGADFGKFRMDGKVRIVSGDVDGISTVTNVASVAGGNGPDAILGVATANIYFDIPVKSMEERVVPYVGFGAGIARGFMQAQGTMTTLSTAATREDHRNDGGLALAGMVGALFPINDHFGITAEYEYLNLGFGSADLHSASVGLRMSF
jgi:opacity protein-like surface antigen